MLNLCSRSLFSVSRISFRSFLPFSGARVIPVAGYSGSAFFFRSTRLAPALLPFDVRGKKKKGGKSNAGNSAQLEEMAAQGVDMNLLEEKMNKTIDFLNNSLSVIRSERISPALIENILVELPVKESDASGAEKRKKKKGNTVPLRNIADISILDHRNLIVNAHDAALEKVITRALHASEGGFSPQPHTGQGIKVPVPRMTIEFREQLEKQINKLGEDCKESLRRTRKEGMDQLKLIKSIISKDEAFRQEKKIKELVDKMTKVIADRVSLKVKEVKEEQ